MGDAPYSKVFIAVQVNIICALNEFLELECAGGASIGVLPELQLPDLHYFIIVELELKC